MLALMLIFPFAARSQSDGIKVVSNPKPSEKPPKHPVILQDMAMLQEQGTTGGATRPSGISSFETGIYLEPGWTNGQVMLGDESVIDNVLMRYDIYHQQLQFIREKDTLAFSKPEEMKYFMLDDKKMIYAEFENNNIIGKSFFEVLSDGYCQLLLHRIVKYHLKSDDISDQTDDLYIRECKYYIIKDSNVATPVRACKKSVLCAFKDKEDQVRDYMKNNKLKMKTCDQLKEVVDFYNSLQ